VVCGETANLSRRNLLESVVVLDGLPLFWPSLQAQNTVRGQGTVRDRFWMYGQEPGTENGQYNLAGKPYITEVAARSRGLLALERGRQ
jgi:hypothetical protein